MPDVTMNAGRVTVVITADGANFSSAMKDVNKQMENFGASSQRVHHGAVSDLQATSAGVRLFQGDITRSMRTVERFLSTIPGVPAALKVAFPVIGGALFGVMLVDLGKKMHDFIQNARDMPKALAEGFGKSTAEMDATLGGLQMKLLQDQDKLRELMGKPPSNGAAIALQEVRNAAFELGKTLDADVDKINQLLKSNSLGFLGGLVQGSVGNSDVQKWFQSQYRSNVIPKILAMDDAAQKMKSTNQNDPTHQAYIAAKQAVRDAMQGIIDGAYQAIDKAKNTHESALSHGTFGPQSLITAYQSLNPQPVIDANRDVINSMKQAQQQLQMMDAVSSTEGQIKTQQGKNDAAAAALAAANEKAKELAETYRFYSEASKKWLDWQKQNTEQLEEQSRSAQELSKWSSDMVGKSLFASKSTTEGSQGQVAAQKYLDDLARIREKGSEALEEENIKLAEANGTLSKHAAALALATLHTKQYQEALAELQAQQAHAADAGEYYQLGTQIATLQANQPVQAARDATSDSFVKAVNDWTNTNTDLPKQLASVFLNFVNSLNESLASALMGRPHETGHEYRLGIRNALGGSVRGLGTGLLNSEFQEGEGSLMKLLGFGGKPDGSQARPFYTIPVAGPGGGPGGGSGPFGISLPGMGNEWGGNSNSSSTQYPSNNGGFFGTFVPQLLRRITGGGGGGGIGGGSGDDNSDFDDDSADSGDFDIPFFAGGGDLQANYPAIVGEQGPELFMPASSGRIIPNDQLGGTMQHTVNVDARGSSDPAATEMAVHRAMRAYLPQMGSIAIAAMQDHRNRTPLGRRG